MNASAPPGIILAICMALMSCADNSTDSTMSSQYAFANSNYLAFTADSRTISRDHPLVLTITGMPLVSGKGRIEVVPISHTHGGMMIVESPIHDTVVTREPNDTSKFVARTSMPFTFVARQEFTVQWKLSFTNIEHHMFGAVAAFDSVFVPDSGRFYSTDRLGLIDLKQALGIERTMGFSTTATNSSTIEVWP